jgi:hypothetical protein
VLAITCAIAGLSQGDVLTIGYTRAGEDLARASSNGLIAGATGISAFIDADGTQPFLDSTVVATGVATYSTLGTQHTMPLPDIWWPWEVIMTLSLPTGAVNSALAVIETDDA